MPTRTYWIIRFQPHMKSASFENTLPNANCLHYIHRDAWLPILYLFGSVCQWTSLSFRMDNAKTNLSSGALYLLNFQTSPHFSLESAVQYFNMHGIFCLYRISVRAVATINHYYSHYNPLWGLKFNLRHMLFSSSRFCFFLFVFCFCFVLFFCFV